MLKTFPCKKIDALHHFEGKKLHTNYLKKFITVLHRFGMIKLEYEKDICLKNNVPFPIIEIFTNVHVFFKTL